MSIPTEDDWRSEPWGIDTPYAYEHFFGKSITEATRLFQEPVLCYHEDMMYLPHRVFGYYLRAYIAHLTSDLSKGDCHGASSFVSLIDFKSEHDPETLSSVWPEVEPVLKHIAEHQDFYDAEWTIFGDFRAQLRPIAERGFPMTIDLSLPEVVPVDATLASMSLFSRHMSFEAAVQVFRNSGIEGISTDSQREDIVRILGEPDTTGGGNHPEYGSIPDWVRYTRSECYLRFQFDGQRVEQVTVMPLNSPFWWDRVDRTPEA